MEPVTCPTSVGQLHKHHAEMQLKQALKADGHIDDAEVCISKPACIKRAESFNESHVPSGSEHQADRTAPHDPQDRWTEEAKVLVTPLHLKKRVRLETNMRGRALKDKLKNAYAYEGPTKASITASYSKLKATPGKTIKKIQKKTGKAALPSVSASAG